MPESGFEAFRHLVLQDQRLQALLRDEPDQQKFLALAVRLGAERNCQFSADDVLMAMQVARQTWLLREVRR